MTRVTITQDGDVFSGVIENSEPTTRGERWIVGRDDGTKSYVYPSEVDVQVDGSSSPEPPSQVGPAHLAPIGSSSSPPPMPPEIAALQAIKDPPRAAAFQAPAPGVSRGGSGVVPNQTPIAIEQTQTAAPAPAAVPAPAPITAPTRFIVNTKTGKPKVFHTRVECSYVGGDAKLTVGDEAIAFFGLSLCATCERLERQVTITDALVEVLGEHLVSISQDMAGKVIDGLVEMGFRISPKTVDRK